MIKVSQEEGLKNEISEGGIVEDNEWEREKERCERGARERCIRD
jgi:hypothetical protein